MIQLQISKKSINAVEKIIHSKVKQAEVIISPNSLTEIGKAVFTITSSRFLKDLSMAAMENPKKYHHLYEWNRIGSNTNKLFIIRRDSVKNGNVSISFIPVKSSRPVPIDPELLEPGPTGKIVHTQHIFKDKMKIMEEGRPIYFETRKTIAFNSNFSGTVFVPKKHTISIMHPGGEQTANSLKEFSMMWFEKNAPQAVSESRLIRQIGNEVARTLNDGHSTASRVQDTIRRVTSAYSKGEAEF